MRLFYHVLLAVAMLLAARHAPAQFGAISGTSDQGTSTPLEAVSQHVFKKDSEQLDRSAIDLSTPRRSLQNFINSARDGHYERAALSLDFSTLRESGEAFEPVSLARKLKAVMDQTHWITWSDVPNEPDGTFGHEADPSPKKVVSVAKIPLNQRDFDFTMRRVEREDSGQVWLISGRVVEQIDALYQEHGLGWLGEVMPPLLQKYRFLEIALWQWIGLVLFIFASYFIGRVIRAVVLRVAIRFWPGDEDKKEERRKRIPEHLGKPLTLAASIVVYQALTEMFLGLAEPVGAWFTPLLVVLIVLSFAWLLNRLLGELAQTTLENYGERLKERDAVRARTLRTQIDVMRRVVGFLVVLVAIGIALSQFEIFRVIGTSLLASAGIAGIVIGLAAQRTMSNIFAGIQLALTSPVNIGDSVVIEGEWGWIEEITNTYVVIRIWDLRRLVIPINYLLDHPIQNWTRTSSDLLNPVYIYTDYRCPVDRVREELKRICEGTDLWDGKVQLIQVTDCTNDIMVIRALVSSEDAGKGWDLKCLVREELVRFLQTLDNGRYLPRTRVEFHRLEEKEREQEERERKKETREPAPEDSKELNRVMKEEEEKRKQREREKTRKDE